MFRSQFRVVALSALLFIGACGGGKSPSDSPANVAVTAGDGRAIVRWTQQSDLTYWIFRARASGITRDDYNKFPEAHIDSPVDSPRAVTGLTNAETYSFVMNATKKAGPAGPASTSQSAKPKLAGDSWTVQTVVGAANANDVIFANQKFYAVGNSATIFEGVETLGAANDTDNKITWTKREVSGITDDLRGIVFNSGPIKFVAVGAAGRVLGSADGISWTASGVSSTATPNLNAVAFGNSVYVAVGEGGTIYSSSDASIWNERKSNIATNINDVNFVSGRFVAVGVGGFIATSTDAITWTTRDSPSSQNLNAVAFGSSKYVIVGDAGTILLSDDSEKWNVPTNLPPAVTQNLYDINFGSRFIAVGAGGVVTTSTTDANGDLEWQSTATGTSDLFATTFGLGANVAVGSAGANSYSW